MKKQIFTTILVLQYSGISTVKPESYCAYEPEWFGLCIDLDTSILTNCLNKCIPESDDNCSSGCDESQTGNRCIEGYC